MLHIPGRETSLGLGIPADKCCNCGTMQQVVPMTTKLKHTRYLLLAGTELTFTLDLPFCKRCAGTRNRYRQSLMSKALVFALAFAVLFLAGTFLPTDLALLQHVPLTWAAVIAAAAFTIAFYALRRAKPPQTSFYQPVGLAGLDQKFSGEITAIRLRCSNAAFARALKTANPELVNSGALIILTE